MRCAPAVYHKKPSSIRAPEIINCGKPPYCCTAAAADRTILTTFFILVERR